MAGRKEFELLFQLKATLGSSYNSTFKNAIDTSKKLQNSLSQLNSVAGKIDSFKKQTTAVENNRKKLAELNAEHDRLQKELKETESPSESLKKKIEQNARQIEKTTAAIKDQETRLDALGKELRATGVDTDNLSKENEKLAKTYDRVKKSQANIARITAEQEKTRAAISDTKSELTKTLGVIGAVGAAIYAGPVKSAMKFESSMAEVAKVVDWINKSGTPKEIQQYNELKRTILDITTQIPMTAEEVAAIIAAAGQANVALDNAGLAKFAQDAAKMGIAFDTTADQAGDWMAKWRTSFGLTQDQVVTLADKINYLGNTSPANARQISEIVTKIGPLGEVAGFANGEIAAMGATLVGVGVSEDVAATGIKKLMTTMTAGAATTKKQKAVLDSLGISATELAERMQKDAQGAVIDLLAAVKRLPEAEQAAAMKNYFGQEAVAALAPLLTNLPLLEEQFMKVGDASLYAGSMEAEYAARADTTENKIQLAKNSLTRLSTTLGETFLPYVGQAAEKLSELITKLSDWAAENPEALKTILKVAGGLAGLKVGALGAKLGFLEIKDGVLSVQKIFAMFRGNMAQSAAEAALGGGKIASMGKSLSSYFGGIKSSLGGLGGSIDKLAGGKLGSLFSKIGGGIQNGILKPLGGIGGKLGGIISGAAGKITGPFAKIGNAIANGPIGQIGGKIGGVFQSLGGTITSVLGGPLKGLGSMFGGLFGKAMPLIMIISALSILFLKLSGEDISGFIEPIKQAFEEAKPVLQALMMQFKELGKQLLPLLLDAAKKLAPLLGQIIAGILPVVLELISAIVPLIMDLVRQLLPVILDIITQLAPLLANIITQILPIVVQLLQTLLPIISQLVTAVLPIIVDVLNAILPLVMQLIQAVLPVLMSLLQALMPVIQLLADAFSGALGGAINAIKPILDGLIQILTGIIDFVTGVFTGNWSQAWEGIKNIFGGVFSSLVELVKAPFRVVVGVINGVIGGLNKLKVPDWVPLIGGKGINIPLIPEFAKGTKNTPDTFIAGEAGAELVTNARGRTVFTAAQTGRIFDNLLNVVSSVRNAAGGMGAPRLQAAFAGAGAPSVSAPSLTAPEPRATSVVIHSQPNIYVSGEKPGDLEEKLNAHDEELLRKMEEKLKKEQEDERRRRYD